MKVTTALGDITQIKTDIIIINLFEGIKTPAGATAAGDKKLGGAITRMIEREEFTGKHNEITVIHSMGKLPADKIILVGLGKAAELDTEKIRQVAAVTAQKAKALKAQKAVSLIHGAGAGNISPELAAQAITEGALMGVYAFKKYLSKPEKAEKPLVEFCLIEKETSKLTAIKKGIKIGTVMAESVCLARDLVNEPPNTLTPTELANRAKSTARTAGYKCKVLGLKEIKALKMGGLLGVASGSVQEPRVIIMEYRGKPKSKETLGIIGKGLTYDSGGLSLKPANFMEDMKCDMSGAAAAIGTMRTIAILKPKLNVTAIIVATENMPSGSAYRPGDILTSASGKTIEIFNTDAEGRLCLADGITLAKKMKLSPLIDIATLTGACSIAVGPYYSGLFTNEQPLADEFLSAAKQTSERFWQLPMAPEYAEMMKSKIADIKNTAGGREGGASTAAKFLEFFVEKTPWLHLDIAATAYTEKPTHYITYGGTGVTIRTLVQYVLNQSK